jgi:predicted 3-demethylubiquinone-9 3-methyltransferase (glyoxalase superfamily)
MDEIQQKIVPHLWFDREAREAAGFYCAIFPDSGIANVTTLHDTPSGDCDVVSFKLWGSAFMAISVGPLFRFNPSISFMVNFDPSRDADATARLDEAWAKLSEGGKVLTPLDRCPFSEHYGWIQDKFGVSWQLILANPEGEERPPVIPSLLFVGDVYGKAEEASDVYLSLFGNSQRGQIVRYPAGMEPDREGAVMFTDFMLEGQWFAAMDSAQAHDVAFNEAVSFVVNCADQKEIDGFWEPLSAVPDAEVCGWLKDRYGLSWQIVPGELSTMMTDTDPERVNRVTRAVFEMKKLDRAALQEAYDGRWHDRNAVLQRHGVRGPSR